MVKPLSFKGDKKTKKRKRQAEDDEGKPTTERAVATTADAETTGEGDGQAWVSADFPTDISGPVLIVLPSTPPSCVACDVNGKVFASELENLVEGNPNTAEPHDVRQVWVATRVIGSDSVSFKGHHGKYLSCDKFGILSANSSAISALESFVPISSPDSPGMISFQICGGDVEAYISFKEPNSTSVSSAAPVEIRGDSNEISFSTSCRVRMQAKFKPKSKSAAARESRAQGKISRKELEEAVGRKLNDDEVKRLRRSRRQGNYHEEILDVRVKGKHDKFASC